MRWTPLALVVVSACAERPLSEVRPTDAVRLAVAPLTLPGIGKACYDLEVRNGAARTGEVVWSRGTPGLNGGVTDPTAICSDRYGSGSDITYIAPCDAAGQLDPDPEGERVNSVTVWVDGLYDTNGAYLAPTGTHSWQNPCDDGCSLDVLCEENRDTLAAFDLTVMRDANQGFFDVAVNFEDIFCSAKLDCRSELLHRGDVRDATAVVAFACASGVRKNPCSR